MQAISAELTEEQKRQDQLYYRRVEIAKLYWHVGDQKYKWDTLENIDAYISEDHGGVSIAKWKADVRAFNEWKSPNFTITVDNRRNYWSEIETGGIWQTGANQPYVVELTKIRVRCGQYLPDGTEEDKYTFSGLIEKPLSFHEEDDNTATISCIGYDEKLRRVNAELLSTPVADELLGSDAGTVFTTANNGVGGIPPVIKKGVTGAGPGAATILKAGIDYTLSDTDKKLLPLKVTLAIALTAGNSAWTDYRYWFQDKDLSWIVTQLLILADIASYNVDPTIFETLVRTTWTQTTKADWDAGTLLQNVDTTKTSGDLIRKWFLIDNFADGNYTTNPTWTVVKQSGAGWQVVAQRLRYTAPGAAPTEGIISTPLQYAYGTWEINIELYAHAASETRFHFISSAQNVVNSNGYHIRITQNTVSLYRSDGSPSGLPLGSAARAAGTTYTWRITRSASGQFLVYQNGVLRLNITDNTYSASSYIGIHQPGMGTGGTPYDYYDDLYYSQAVDGAGAVSTAIALHESQVLDTGAGNPDSWGLLTYSITTPGGTSVPFETYSSGTSDFSADNDPAGWVALGITGQINSANKRYFKARPTLSANLSAYTTPILHDYAVNYYTSTVTFPLVNLTGMNVQQAIQRCAEMPCYEIGFNTDESYFYRARTSTGAAVLTIDSKTNLEKEISFNTGTDRIKTVVDVTFGPYRTIVDPDTEGEAHPHVKDRLGEKRYVVTGSTLLPPEGADVATATAQTIYAYTSVQRERAQVQMKFLLQYQLGDVTDYHREHKFGRWRLGDTDRRLGDDSDPDFVFYSAAMMTTLWNYNMRIEGIEFDTKKWRTKLDLVRIS